MKGIVDVESEEFQSVVNKVAERIVNEHKIAMLNAHIKEMVEFKWEVYKHFGALERSLSKIEKTMITKHDMTRHLND